MSLFNLVRHLVRMHYRLSLDFTRSSFTHDQTEKDCKADNSDSFGPVHVEDGGDNGNDDQHQCNGYVSARGRQGGTDSFNEGLFLTATHVQFLSSRVQAVVASHVTAR